MPNDERGQSSRVPRKGARVQYEQPGRTTSGRRLTPKDEWEGDAAGLPNCSARLRSWVDFGTRSHPWSGMRGAAGEGDRADGWEAYGY